MERNVENLASRVKSVSRKGYTRSVIAALAVTVLATCGAFLVASILDVAFWLPGALRGALLLGTAVGAVILARKAFVNTVSHFGSQTVSARTIENNFPEIERSLSTAIEFGSDEQKTEDYSSKKLVDQLVERTQERTLLTPFGQAVNWKALSRVLAAVAAAALLIVAYAAVLPHMATATAWRFFSPMSDTPPPTWTVIDELAPGNMELPRGGSARIEVSLSGAKAEGIRLMVRGKGETEWAESEMAPDAERRYYRTLTRVVRETEYRVKAGDAVSQSFLLTPIDEPRIESIKVHIKPPKYTGLDPADLPEGSGDIRSPAGTEVELTVRPNMRSVMGTAELTLGRDRKQSTLELKPVDDTSLELKTTFKLTESGEYQIKLADNKGRQSRDEPVFRLTAIPDRMPKVRITRPQREVMAAKDQKVELEIEASDDWGVAEIGIVSTIGGSPERITIEKPEGKRERTAKYTIDLSMRGLKGGEIITYYGYVIDNDEVTGPKEAVGEIRFLRTYDEEKYSMQGMPGEKKTPKAVKEVDKLLDRQMKLARESFDIARRAGRKKKPSEEDSKQAGEDQQRLKRDLDDFADLMDKELTNRKEADQPAMQAEELLELNNASKKMNSAAKKLDEVKPKDAAAPQAQAIASLSRTRRIMLSQSSNSQSSSKKQAMQSAGRKQQEQRRQQRRKDLEELDKEAKKLPPILKRQEENRRKLEQLEDEPPPPPSQANQLAQQQRQLAEEAKQAAQKMQSLGRKGNSSMPDRPQRRLMEAAEQMERAADAAQKRDFKQAAKEAREAEDKLASASSAAKQAMRDMARQRIQGAANEAKDLADRQNKLAQSKGGKPSEDAKKQEGMKQDFDNLMKEVESLANKASSEGRPEASALRDAQLGQEMSQTGEEMKEAAQKLRDGKQDESKPNQQSAARSLRQLARGLNRASQQANASARRDLADAVRRAEELARDIKSMSDAAKNPEQNPKDLAGEAGDLQKEAKDLARTASSFSSRGEDSPIRRAERDLRHAGRELERAGKELKRPDRESAAKASDRAREDAKKAADALREAAFGDLAKTLAEARDAASRAAKQQEQTRANLDAANPEAGKEALDKAREAASQKQAEAEESARKAASKLSAAASAARDLDSELSDMIEQEANRSEEERLPGRMGSLGAQLSFPSPEDKSSKESLDKERCQASKLEKAAQNASGRLQALASEAKDDELEALRSASEDAKSMAKKLKELDDKLAKARQEGDKQSDKEQTDSNRELAEETKGLMQDAKSLRTRVERRVAELLRGTESKGKEVDDKIATAERELEEIARRLSRHQRQKPSNRLRSGAVAYQVLGEGIVQKIERIIKQREYRPPENEEAPAEYRELVERYFRALSED